jgi:DNA-binding MarR family transcriptional regulator
MNLSSSNLGFLLAKASARFNELLVARFAEAGFPEVRASYGSVIVPLAEEDGLRMGEIGRRARLSKPSMTALVRRCEEDGLVRRERDPSDGRAFRIVLTDRGRRLAEVAEAALRELDARLTERLGDDDRDALERGLRGMMYL